MQNFAYFCASLIIGNIYVIKMKIQVKYKNIYLCK